MRLLWQTPTAWYEKRLRDSWNSLKKLNSSFPHYLERWSVNWSVLSSDKENHYLKLAANVLQHSKLWSQRGTLEVIAHCSENFWCPSSELYCRKLPACYTTTSCTHNSWYQEFVDQETSGKSHINAKFNVHTIIVQVVRFVWFILCM